MATRGIRKRPVSTKPADHQIIPCINSVVVMAVMRSLQILILSLAVLNALPVDEPDDKPDELNSGHGGGGGGGGGGVAAVVGVRGRVVLAGGVVGDGGAGVGGCGGGWLW